MRCLKLNSLEHTLRWFVAVQCCVGLVALIAMGPGAMAGQPVDAYFAECIWTGEGEALSDGVLVVRGGRIVAVGEAASIAVPENAVLHHLGPVTLIPGLVVAQSGLVESNRSSEYAVSPEVRAVDGFDSFADYDRLLAGGVTTVQISPAATRLIPGQGAVVKLAGEDSFESILRESESLTVVLRREGLSPPTIYEPPVGAVSVDRPIETTQPQLATSLAQGVAGLQAFWAEADEILAGRSTTDRRLAALAELKARGVPVRWNVDNAAEVKAALRLSQEFGLNWILVDPAEVDLLNGVDWKAESAVGVVLNAGMRPGRIVNPVVLRDEQKKPVPIWERARQLVDAGAIERIAFRAATDADLDKLLFLASLLGRGGLTSDQILRTLTVNPARMLGVADRVGRLRPNADADFVVLSGRPFSSQTRVVSTYVNGQRVFHGEASEDVTVIRAAAVYTSDGWLTDARLTVANGKIQGVGKSASASRDAQIKDFGEAFVVPGMLDLSTALGVGSSLGESIPLGTKLGDVLSRDDPRIEVARRGGVTTALLSSTRLPSPVVAFKFTQTPRVLRDPVALRFKVDGNLTSSEASLRRSLKAGQAYAQAWTKYEREFAEYQAKLKTYEVEKKKYDAAVKAAAKQEAERKAAAKKDGHSKDEASDDGEKDAQQSDSKKPGGSNGSSSKEVTQDKDPESSQGDQKSTSKGGKAEPNASDQKDAKTDSKDSGPSEPKKPTEPKKPKKSDNSEPYRALFAKKLVAMVDVSHAKAVELVVKLFREEFDVKTAVVAGQAAVAKAHVLAKHDVMVVVGPTLVSEVKGDLVNHPAELLLSQVPIGFQSKASTGASVLPDVVAYAVYEGLGAEDALHGLTAASADFFGLDSVGTIQVGKDADLVVLSGPPLELSTQVLAVMIDGKWVYEKESSVHDKGTK